MNFRHFSPYTVFAVFRRGTLKSESIRMLGQNLHIARLNRTKPGFRPTAGRPRRSKPPYRSVKPYKTLIPTDHRPPASVRTSVSLGQTAQNPDSDRPQAARVGQNLHIARLNRTKPGFRPTAGRPRRSEHPYRSVKPHETRIPTDYCPQTEPDSSRLSRMNPIPATPRLNSTPQIHKKHKKN